MVPDSSILLFIYIPLFFLALLIRLIFAAVCKHRDRKTLKVIGITSIFSYYFSIKIANSIEDIIYYNDLYLQILICGIPVVLVTFFLEGLVYYKFAPSIKHPFYFALAMNAFLLFLAIILPFLIDEINRYI